MKRMQLAIYGAVGLVTLLGYLWIKRTWVAASSGPSGESRKGRNHF